MKSAVTISSPTTSDKTQQQPFHQQAQDQLLPRWNTTIQELSSHQFIIYYHNSTLYLITYQHHKTKQLPFHYSVLLHTIVSLFSNFSLWSLQDQAAQNEKIMTPHFQSVSVTVPVYSWHHINTNECYLFLFILVRLHYRILQIQCSLVYWELWESHNLQPLCHLGNPYHLTSVT